MPLGALCQFGGVDSEFRCYSVILGAVCKIWGAFVPKNRGNDATLKEHATHRTNSQNYTFLSIRGRRFRIWMLFSHSRGHWLDMGAFLPQNGGNDAILKNIEIHKIIHILSI